VGGRGVEQAMCHLWKAADEGKEVKARWVKEGVCWSVMAT